MKTDRGALVRLSTPALSRLVWWGQPWQLGTAAYWGEIARTSHPPRRHALGASLVEEVAVCVLGGFGMPAQVGLAAFERVLASGLLEADDEPNLVESLQALLSEPLMVRGRTVRYRFPRQRGARLAAALAWLRGARAPEDHRLQRDWLTGAPGIGPKTASWIVRNRHDCDSVAIIDVHIRRAGLAAGVFDPRWDLGRDYGRFEAAFLDWADTESVRPSMLDACIWAVLANGGPAVRQEILGAPGADGWPTAVWPS